MTAGVPMSDRIELAELGRLGARLGGGRADVHQVPDVRLPDVAGPLVFKRYRPSQQPAPGLRTVIGMRRQLDETARAALDAVASWPVRIVEDGGDIRGVLMPLAAHSFFQEHKPATGRVRRRPRELRHLFAEPAVTRRLGMTMPDTAQRMALCRDLAAALALLHHHGVVFGSLDTGLFRPHPEPTVLLLGCDTVLVRGGAPVSRQVLPPAWTPPEGTVPSQAADLYRLGLFVLRVLSTGPQASTTRDPSRVLGLLDPEGCRLITQALSPAGRQRPAAASWHIYFSRRTPPVGVAGSHNLPATPTRTAGWRRDPGTGRWVRRELPTASGPP